MSLSIPSALKLPLTLAVSSVLLAACSSKQPTYQTSTSTTPITTTPTTSNNTVVTANNSGTLYDTTLDAETLSILEDLLEARDVTMVEGDLLSVQRHGDLWDRVRQGYKMQQPIYNDRIEAQKNWFASRQAYLDRLTARASRYLHHTVSEAERRGIPTELALLPIIESSYDPSATSNAAAAGLWQFIPSTGRIYGLNQTSTYDGRRDVIESTRAAYDFLTSLYNQFGSWELALAAYNAGPGRIQRAINSNAAQSLPTDYWSLTLPTETMNYVPRFMAVAQIVGNPKQYGVSFPAIANHTHFRTVPVNYGTSLYDVSSLTGVPMDELQLLNPALTNLRVDASGPNRVVIPNSLSPNVDTQLQNMGGMTASAPVQTTSYIASSKPVVANPSYTQELKQANALPTTTATLTANNTIIQEPPLSAEEVAFIAEQIRLNAPEAVTPINPADGKIELDAVQTSQSVLDARGQQKSLRYDPPPAATATNSSGAKPAAPAIKPKVEPKGKQSTYVVKRGDTLTSIANNHGVSMNDLAQWNQINPNANLLAGTRLKLYDAKPKTQSTAAQTSTQSTNKATESYVVQSGDTLTRVAAKHNLSVSQLASYNNLSTDSQLLRGQTLWLVPNKVKTDSAKTSAQSKASAQSSKTYKVKSGDTLTSVANALGVTTNDIAKLNDFDSNAKLIAGQTIKVPASANTSTTTNAQASSTSGRTLSNTENYKVKSGESLTSIANKYGVSVADLAKTNNLSTNASLRIGQTIKVPKLTTTYKVKSGDSLIGLAKKYGMSVDELAKMNNLKANEQLKIGQVLTVPNQ